MAYPFLPVNPCCTDVVINDPCGCSSTITNSGCNNNNPCSTHLTASSTIVYDGPVLPCIVAEPCDTLNVILQKIDEIICNLLTQINYLTNQVNNITIQIININGDIINIYNILDECCGATTTTTSTTTAAPCESFSLDNTGTEAVAIIITDCITGDQEAIVLLPGETNICVETDSPLTVPGTVIVTPNGPCGPTTTTTSSSSTTTTTTTIAFECQCFTFFNSDTSAHVINYKNCDGVNIGPIFIDSNETLQVCAGSGSASDPLVTISVGANCIDGLCPVGPTTTTTTTEVVCNCFDTEVTILSETLANTDNGQLTVLYEDCFTNPYIDTYDRPGVYPLGCVDFTVGITALGEVEGVEQAFFVPVTIGSPCCDVEPTTTTTTTFEPTTTTTTTIPCTCINIIISQADIDDATGNTTLNGNVNIAGSNGKQITCENEDIVIHYDTAGTYPYCLKTGEISGLSLFYLKDNDAVTNIQSEIVNLQSACTVDGECGPTTTTTTTIPPTTTTTTTSGITCDCLTFENTDTISHNLGYTNCSNFPVTGINIDPSEIISFCGDNPVVSNPSVTITFGGACVLEVCPTTTTTTTILDCSFIGTADEITPYVLACTNGYTGPVGFPNRTTGIGSMTLGSGLVIDTTYTGSALLTVPQSSFTNCVGGQFAGDVGVGGTIFLNYNGGAFTFIITYSVPQTAVKFVVSGVGVSGQLGVSEYYTITTNSTNTTVNLLDGCGDFRTEAPNIVAGSLGPGQSGTGGNVEVTADTSFTTITITGNNSATLAGSAWDMYICNAESTTTTTTTVEPTTTTTTTLSDCLEYSFDGGIAGGTFTYINCVVGPEQTYTASPGNTGVICVNQVTGTTGTVSVVLIGNCPPA